MLIMSESIQPSKSKGRRREEEEREEPSTALSEIYLKMIK